MKPKVNERTLKVVEQPISEAKEPNVKVETLRVQV